MRFRFAFVVTTLLLFAVMLYALTYSPEATIAEGVAINIDQFQQGQTDNMIVTNDGLMPHLAESTASFQSLFTSEVIQSTNPFNAVVPEWEAVLPANVQLSVRVRTGTADNLNWSFWTPVAENHDWTLPEDVITVGDMITVAEDMHQLVQFEVGFSGQSSAGERPILKAFHLTFIDSTQGPTSTEITSRLPQTDQIQPNTPDGKVAKPYVVPRSTWCTDPACNYDWNTLEYTPTSHLIVHHTVSKNELSDWASHVRAIWYYHTVQRGWGDIGYNYLIDMNGVIYEGHLGGDNVKGTHAAGANQGSMGIALIGTFTDSQPSAAMLESATKLLAWKADQQDIDVYGSAKLPSVNWGLPTLMGHRDAYGTTSCPGHLAHNHLPDLREQVAQRLGFTNPYTYIDDLDSGFSRSDANWFEGPLNCGFNTHTYYTLSTTDMNQSTNWGTWRLDVPVNGRYEVDVFIPFCATGQPETQGATYSIIHADGTTQVVVDQDASLGLWTTLGTFDMAAGSGSVYLSDFNAVDNNIPVWFDAVRYRRVDGQDEQPESVTLLNGPKGNEWVSDNNVTLSWQTSNVNALQKIKVEVATDEAFNNVILAQEIPPTDTQMTIAFDRSYAQLYWRLLLLNNNQSWASTPANSFKVDVVPPRSVISSVSVADNGEYTLLVSANDDLAGVESYHVQYRQQGTDSWNTVAQEQKDPTVSLWLNTSFPYEFRVMAKDKVGNVEPEKVAADFITVAKENPTPRPTDQPLISPTDVPRVEFVDEPYIYYFPFMSKQ